MRSDLIFYSSLGVVEVASFLILHRRLSFFFSWRLYAFLCGLCILFSRPLQSILVLVELSLLLERTFRRSATREQLLERDSPIVILYPEMGNVLRMLISFFIAHLLAS